MNPEHKETTRQNIIELQQMLENAQKDLDNLKTIFSSISDLIMEVQIAFLGPSRRDRKDE